MHLKKIYLLSMPILAVICTIAFLAYYFFFTTRGSSSIAKFALSKYTASEKINIKGVDGNLSQTLSFKDIIFEDLEFLPQGSIVKINKLDLSFASFNPPEIKVNIHNGALRMPSFNTIIFNGSYQQGSLEINVYSKNVGVRETLDLFTQSSDLKKISGMISDLDVYVKGSFLKPQLTGEFQIRELSRNGFSITNCPGRLDLQLNDIKEELKIFGTIFLSSGIVTGPKGTSLNLQECMIIFNGNPKKPSFDLRGASTVEGTKINIALKGTLEKPELKLTSEPSLPQGQLLVMLATGKAWKGTGKSISSGQLSPDLAADFIDYFAFGGMGSKIAKQLGISEISLKFDKETKGVGLKKEITNKAGVTYGVEQTQTKEKDTSVTQKVGGEYKVTDTISVGAEREFKQDDKTKQTEDQDKLQTEDKVLLKFKKEF
ncbi:MAG: translocation/assembly module TamB domain-containing protein [Candidatus Omnitrophota bacterium]